MQRVLRSGVLAALVVVLGAVPAQAGLPIPCTGESAVKVRDVPNAPRTRDGQRIALGYKFKGCFGGEWVGYVGSNTQYIRLSKRNQLSLIVLAGYKQIPPPAPSRWQHPRELIVPGIWGAVAAFGIVGTLLNSAYGGTSAPKPQAPPPYETAQSERLAQRRRQFAK